MIKNLKQKKKSNMTKNQAIISYLVATTIIEVEENSDEKIHHFTKKFESTNNLTNRREAIKHYLLQAHYLNNFSKINFSSEQEIENKDYKDYKSYDLSIKILHPNLNKYKIDESELVAIHESLKYEFGILNNNININFLDVYDCRGFIQKIDKKDYIKLYLESNI